MTLCSMSLIRNSMVSLASFSLNRKLRQPGVSTARRAKECNKDPFKHRKNLTKKDKTASVKEPKLLYPNTFPKVGLYRKT